jgi:hypothetical protein
MSVPGAVRRSPTRYFWTQLAILAAGVGVLVFAHGIAARVDDPVDGTDLTTMIVSIMVVAAAVGSMARANYVIVTSGFSDAYRVFRARHLFVCAALLFVVASTALGWVIAHDAFRGFFSHGRVTGEDVVDVGLLTAALISMVGAGSALAGSWDSLHVERHWHLHLHRTGHRRAWVTPGGASRTRPRTARRTGGRPRP